MTCAPTLEELLAEREVWQKERRQLQVANARLRSEQSSDRGEIDRLRQIIASLQHKLFGNRKHSHPTGCS